MGGGKEYRGDNEILQEPGGNPKVVRLSGIRANGGGKNGQFTRGGRRGQLQGSYRGVTGASETAKATLIVVANALPSEGA